MSMSSKYGDSAARQVPIQDACQARSDSGGVDVVLKGCRTGLNKVQLTKTFRAGGISLSEAAKLTGQVLDGIELRVHLDQFPTLGRAQAVLREIGIAEIHE